MPDTLSVTAEAPGTPTPWYADEDLWTGFATTMFSDRRAAEVDRLVATSPLLDFAGARVLEQGCGPGLFLVPLARRGDRVTGLDLSAAMLDGARAALGTAGVEAELVRGDMRGFTRPETFDVVLNVFTSFGYFDTAEENLAVARCAHESLVPGGRYVVDLLGKEVLASWVGRPQAVDLPDGSEVFQRDTVVDDWSRLRTDWTLVEPGGAVRRASISSVLYSAVELKGLLAEAGFTDVRAYGGFDGSGYGPGSRRLIVTGVR